MVSKNNKNNLEKSGLLYDLLNLPIVYQIVQFSFRKLNTNSRLFNDFFCLDENVTVLDCGCGPGTYRRYIKSKKYTGLDINENHIKKAKNLYPNDNFLIQDLTEFNSEKIKNTEVVLMIGILHHLPDKVCKSMFENLYKILSPKGKIYTIDPVYISNQRKIAKFLASRDKGNFVRNPESYKNLVGSKYKIDDYLINDLLRVPYDHYFMKIKKRN